MTYIQQRLSEIANTTKHQYFDEMFHVRICEYFSVFPPAGDVQIPWLIWLSGEVVLLFERQQWRGGTQQQPCGGDSQDIGQVVLDLCYWGQLPWMWERLYRHLLGVQARAVPQSGCRKNSINPRVQARAVLVNLVIETVHSTLEYRLGLSHNLSVETIQSTLEYMLGLCHLSRQWNSSINPRVISKNQ